MKKLLSLVALMGVLAFTPANDVFAQQPVIGIKIGVIDINVILREAVAFQSIRQQIGAFRDNFRSEIQQKEEALRKADQELARQKTLLSAEAFAEKRREFETKVVAYQRLAQQRKQNLDKTQVEAMGQVQKMLNVIITELSIEQKISLILRKDQTILANTSLHLTSQVLERLNAKMPTIVVSDPAQ